MLQSLPSGKTTKKLLSPHEFEEIIHSNTQNAINWLSNAPDAIKKLIPEPPEGQSNEENALSGNDKGIVAFIGGILGTIIDGKELEQKEV